MSRRHNVCLGRNHLSDEADRIDAHRRIVEGSGDGR